MALGLNKILLANATANTGNGGQGGGNGGSGVVVLRYLKSLAV